MFKSRSIPLAVATVALLGACAYEQPSPNVPSYVQPPTGTGPNPTPYEQRGSVVPPQQYAYNTGVVSSIELVRGQSSGVSPGGAILGAVVGGLLGNQIGSGGGRAAATVAGVAGGALAGNAIGNRVNTPGSMYRIGIQYDGGGYQYIDVVEPGDLRPGDRVRVDTAGQISRY